MGSERGGWLWDPRKEAVGVIEQPHPLRKDSNTAERDFGAKMSPNDKFKKDSKKIEVEKDRDSEKNKDNSKFEVWNDRNDL